MQQRLHHLSPFVSMKYSLSMFTTTWQDAWISPHSPFVHSPILWQSCWMRIVVFALEELNRPWSLLDALKSIELKKRILEANFQLSKAVKTTCQKEIKLLPQCDFKKKTSNKSVYLASHFRSWNVFWQLCHAHKRLWLLKNHTNGKTEGGQVLRICRYTAALLSHSITVLNAKIAQVTKIIYKENHMTLETHLHTKDTLLL